MSDIVRDHLPIIRKASFNLLYQTGSWKIQSFKNILNEAAWLPKKLTLSKDKIEVYDDRFPKDISRCSVHLLAATSQDQNVIAKVSKLHEVGVIHIGDLVLLHEELINIWRKITPSGLKSVLASLR